MAKHPKYAEFPIALMLGIAIAVIVITIPAFGQSAMPHAYSSPLKQFKSGIPMQNIRCGDGLQLVIKVTSESPACVRPSTADMLVSVGWARLLSEQNTNTAQDQKENKIITLADDDKSVTLKEGQTFLLNLGENYNWNIEIDDQAVVSRVMNVMVIRGAQGIYEAHHQGHATLVAVGDPLCYTSVPACMLPSIQFQLNVQVIP